MSFAAEGLKDAGGGDPEAESLPGMFAHSRDSMIDLTWSDRIFDLSSDHGMVLIISAYDLNLKAAPVESIDLYCGDAANALNVKSLLAPELTEGTRECSCRIVARPLVEDTVSRVQNRGHHLRHPGFK